MRTVERARPLLGTVVCIRAQQCTEAAAHRVIDQVFESVALIGRLMSFQNPDSELSLLNRVASRRAVTVHAHTYRVLLLSRRFAEASGGVFDVSAAHRGGDVDANWRHIELLPHCAVRYRRRLCVDLSGIAKGYAVDWAIAQLRSLGVRRAMVNAGGDLRVIGPESERIALRAQSRCESVAVLELCNGALATSAAAEGATISVSARRCVVADALTKVVTADYRSAASVLRAFGAKAWRHQPVSGWQVMS